MPDLEKTKQACPRGTYNLVRHKASPGAQEVLRKARLTCLGKQAHILLPKKPRRP